MHTLTYTCLRISGRVLLRGILSLARRLKRWILYKCWDFPCSCGGMWTGSPMSPWDGWGSKLFSLRTSSVKLGKEGPGRVSPTYRPTITCIPWLLMYSLCLELELLSTNWIWELLNGPWNKDGKITESWLPHRRSISSPVRRLPHCANFSSPATTHTRAA